MYQNTPFYDIRPIRDFRDMLGLKALRVFRIALRLN